MFFAFEGVDGAGKTTQIGLFCDWLRSRGLDVVECRDPGSTPLGEKVRGVLLDSHGILIGQRSEMLLYMSARAQMVDEVIAPALAAGKVVVSDRFLLSNVVYQGYAGGIDPAAIWQVGTVATHGLLPELSLVLDVSDEIAAQRMNRPLDRIEQRGPEFRAALRRGYLAEAARQPERIVVVDAGREIDAVQTDLRAAAQRVLDTFDRGATR